jgi:hypothetical protein
MANKKTSKRQSTRRASSRVIFRTHVDPDGGTLWLQAGPLFVQSSTFSQTDPFKETMSSVLAQRTTQAKRQAARVLQLLERARKQD